MKSADAKNIYIRIIHRIQKAKTNIDRIISSDNDLGMNNNTSWPSILILLTAKTAATTTTEYISSGRYDLVAVLFYILSDI